jgi:two-component system chemotaxis response regulator CheB
MGNCVIAIGASAGGVEALRALSASFSLDLPAAVLVVLHTSERPSDLPRILATAGTLPVTPVADGAPIHDGTLYVAPAGHHLLVSRGHMHVVEGPKENGFRPAVDPLLRSAGRAYGSGAIGVILSGMLDDGTAGLLAIKTHGGLTVVQDPNDAIAPSMPRSALTYVAVDYVVPVAGMGPLLGRLARERALEAVVTSEGENPPVYGEQGPVDVTGEDAGVPLPFSCPECGGVLSEIHEGTLIRFRCQIGHTYSPQSALELQSAATQRALASALTVVNERALLLRRLAKDATDRNDATASRRFSRWARTTEERQAQMRRLLESIEVAVAGNAEEPGAGERSRTG